MIRFSCPGCGAVFSVTDDKAGKTGKCPKCQTPFTIPAAEAPAAPPPPPPKPTSNPFADLADEDAPKKKKPSKADLDDFDDAPKKKKPARADDDDDYDDRPKKKPARRDEDDDYDDAPKKKKAPSKAELDDDEDDRPKKKPARRDDEDDDYDDRPKKKPARAAADDDYDDEDDRPKKKGKGRRDDDYDDDYDDRPRKKKGKTGLLTAAGVIHCIFALVYVCSGGWDLFFGGAVSTVSNAGGQGIDFTRDPAFTKGMTAKEKADFQRDMGGAKAITNEGSIYGTVMQLLGVMALLGGALMIPAGIGCFMRKKWCVYLTFAAAGLMILLFLIRLVTSFMYAALFLTPYAIILSVAFPALYAGFVLFAVLNKDSKRALS